MHREKRRRKIIIASLLLVLLLMATGYAVFGTNLDIKGSTKVTSNWDVRITNVTSGTPTGNAENSIDIVMLNFSVNITMLNFRDDVIMLNFNIEFRADIIMLNFR